MAVPTLNEMRAKLAEHDVLERWLALFSIPHTCRKCGQELAYDVPFGWEEVRWYVGRNEAPPGRIESYSCGQCDPKGGGE